MNTKEEKLQKIKLLPKLEELGIPYRFVIYETEYTNLIDAALKVGIKKEELIRTSIVKLNNSNAVIFTPHGNNIISSKLAKFIGEKELSILTPEDAMKLSPLSVDNITPIGIGLRFYADMSIMNSKFLAFESGVKGVLLILHKNDVINIFQVSLGYFTKDGD